MGMMAMVARAFYTERFEAIACVSYTSTRPQDDGGNCVSLDTRQVEN